MEKINFIKTFIPQGQYRQKYEYGDMVVYHINAEYNKETNAYECYECTLPKATFDEVKVRAAFAQFSAKLDALKLEEAKAEKIAEITAYDKSPAVNAFYLNGEQHWLDFNLRDRVFDGNERIAYKGREETSLWLDGKCFVMPIAVAQDLICTIEVYAKDCYNVTATHQAEVNKLTTIEEVEAYNYKTGYPEKLNLKV
jgi:hypothetical protein